MKFGDHLRHYTQPEWSFNYMSYDELKSVLKLRTASGLWNETDEGYFVEMLERELEKVHSFQTVKIGEIHRKLKYYNAQAQDFKKNGAEEETWAALEIEIYRVIAEIDVLAKYTRLNYTGFLKIVKKHDVSLPLPLTLSLSLSFPPSTSLLPPFAFSLFNSPSLLSRLS